MDTRHQRQQGRGQRKTKSQDDLFRERRKAYDQAGLNWMEQFLVEAEPINLPIQEIPVETEIVEPMTPMIKMIRILGIIGLISTIVYQLF